MSILSGKWVGRVEDPKARRPLDPPPGWEEWSDGEFVEWHEGVTEKLEMQRTMMQLAADREERLERTYDPECGVCGQLVPKRKRWEHDRHHRRMGEIKDTMIHCRFCDYKTRHLNNMDRHLDAKHLEADHMCHLCPANFPTARALQRHKRIAHDLPIPVCKRPECCPEPGKLRIFASNWHLKRHIETVHNGERTTDAEESAAKWTCDECGHVSRDATRHREHLESHQGLVKCTLCPERVAKGEMAGHLSSAHPDAFVCHECVPPKQFASADSLRKHVRLRRHRTSAPKRGRAPVEPVEGEDELVCTQCDPPVVYKYKKAYQRHMHAGQHKTAKRRRTSQPAPAKKRRTRESTPDEVYLLSSDDEWTRLPLI